jgi:predicted PurR-regulated permease PerM
MARLLVGLAAALWLLIMARGVLQPVVIAGLVWFLLDAVAEGYRRVIPPGWRRARRWAGVASVATFAAGFVALGLLAAGAAQELRASLPLYEARLDRLLAGAAGALGLEDAPRMAQVLQGVDFGALALGLVGSTAAYLLALIVIACYLAFIAIEVDGFSGKLAAMVPDPARRGRIEAVISAAHANIVHYVGVTALIGLAQAIPTFLVLWAVGVKGPLFWAALIFALSFVPTLGTMIGIAFPAAVALLQFDTLGPFLIVAPTLAAVQLLCSNALQPKLMGASLNLSPLAVLLAIFAGGAVWGIVGALVAVPALSIAVIVCAQDPGLRPVALALSARGALPEGLAPPPR